MNRKVIIIIVIVIFITMFIFATIITDTIIGIFEPYGNARCYGLSFGEYTLNPEGGAKFPRCLGILLPFYE